MSKLVSLRALVNERLTAAAEEIFALFERTIAEYEEELCRSEKENQGKPRVLLPRAGAEVHIHSVPRLDREITETVQIKEEPEEQEEEEEEEMSGSLLSSCAAFVKTEESSLFQTQDEDFDSEPGFLADAEGHAGLSPDNDDDRKPLFSCSVAQMETEADGDHHRDDEQVQLGDRSTAAQTSGQSPEFESVAETSVTVNDEDASGSDEDAETKKRQCPLCRKTFRCNRSLQIHIRVHTGEKPYSCPVCDKKLTQKGKLQIHMRTHTNEKPYSCSICNKTFTRKDSLDTHTRIHTGEKPYSCPLCSKGFNQGSNLKKHIKTHTRPHTSQELP